MIEPRDQRRFGRVSKIADGFELDSAGLAWKVDTLRAEQAFGEAKARRGTWAQAVPTAEAMIRPVLGRRS